MMRELAIYSALYNAEIIKKIQDIKKIQQTWGDVITEK
jgi:hypothetical protein